MSFYRSLNLEQENREKEKDKQYSSSTDGESSKCTFIAMVTKGLVLFTALAHVRLVASSRLKSSLF